MGETTKPVFLYHAITTGMGDSLQKFFSNTRVVTASTDFPNSGVQDDGFRLSNNRHEEQSRAKARYKSDKTKGRPMVIIVKAPDKGLQFSWENDAGNAFLLRYQAELQAIPPKRIGVLGHIIEKVDVSEAFEGGMRVTLTGPGNVPVELFPLEPMSTPGARKPPVGKPALRQALRNYLEESMGETFLASEHAAVMKAIEQGNTSDSKGSVDIKYSGTEPLPIAGMEVLTGIKWKPVLGQVRTK